MGATLQQDCPQELADYLLARAGESWMHELMALCQEISWEDVEALRSCGDLLGTNIPEKIDPEAPAPPICADDETPEKIPGAVLEALRKTCGIDDMGVILDIASRLTLAERQEQISLAADELEPKRVKLFVNMHYLKQRNQVAADYDAFIRANYGWKGEGPRPDGSAAAFCKTLLFANGKAPTRPERAIRRWHTSWKKSYWYGVAAGGKRERRGRKQTVHYDKQKRQTGSQGAPRKCQALRDDLYEWWAAMRHSVDWDALKKGIQPQSRPKAIARFTRSMLVTKAKELLSNYCVAALRHGKQANVPKITSHWLKVWSSDYGLSFRKPNRKYKVPKAVLEQRLEKGWLNVFRVRAAVAALWGGHDPSIENWDQSPFHHNESGSQNMPTLGEINALCPLVEGHADTRARWTANLMTCSDASRFDNGAPPPPCECMFKADGQQLRRRLQEHVRSRGQDSWVSASTSEKGSYKMADVMAFLDKHLPPLADGPQSRPPRIILADDHAPHLHPKVAELCWSRGYIFIAHGGGVTPVVQTVDTDLNQEVKRRYTALETQTLLRKMRIEGKPVPHLRQEECIDLMTEVLSDMELHLRAAEGYVKTGFSVPLDDRLKIYT